MKKLLWLFLLLHISPAHAGIGSTLLWPLRAFYDGPYTSCLSKLSGLPKTTVPLSREHTQEVIDVLEEMRVSPSNVKLLIKNDVEPDCRDKYRKAGIFDPRSSASAIGSILVFDHDFFTSIPKPQRRAIIGREAWHIKHMGALKILISVPLISMGTGLMAALHLWSDQRPRYDTRAGDYKEELVVPIICGSMVGLVSLISATSSMKNKHRKEAVVKSASILGCLTDAIDYYQAQLELNKQKKGDLPEKFIIDEDGSIIPAAPKQTKGVITPDDVFDVDGNYKHTWEQRKLTEHLAQLRELIKNE